MTKAGTINIVKFVGATPCGCPEGSSGAFTHYGHLVPGSNRQAADSLDDDVQQSATQAQPTDFQAEKKHPAICCVLDFTGAGDGS